MAWLALAALAGCAAQGAPDDHVSGSTSEVVAGTAEAGYEAVGYLLKGSARDQLRGPYCGVTLVAPAVAVTAAHCVEGDSDDTVLGVGFGDVYSQSPHVVAEVHRNDRHNPSAYRRYNHDVAVLVLEAAVEDREPAKIVPALVDPDYDPWNPSTCDGRMRYVGYGRTTPGTFETSGDTGPRRSARYCVDNIDSLNVWARGRDGGLCWGDSGGPLMVDGENVLVGVLADFADRRFRCDEGNRMIFTSLWGERDFLTRSGVPEDAFQTPERPDVGVAGDEDGDGVEDAVDRCSATPAGARVWTEGEWIGCAGGQRVDR